MPVNQKIIVKKNVGKSKIIVNRKETKISGEPKIIGNKNLGEPKMPMNHK